MPTIKKKNLQGVSRCSSSECKRPRVRGTLRVRVPDAPHPSCVEDPFRFPVGGASDVPTSQGCCID